eukprot:355116-Rhodomonas_salina.1
MRRSPFRKSLEILIPFGFRVGDVGFQGQGAEFRVSDTRFQGFERKPALLSRGAKTRMQEPTSSPYAPPPASAIPVPFWVRNRTHGTESAEKLILAFAFGLCRDGVRHADHSRPLPRQYISGPVRIGAVPFRRTECGP